MIQIQQEIQKILGYFAVNSPFFSGYFDPLKHGCNIIAVTPSLCTIMQKCLFLRASANCRKNAVAANDPKVKIVNR